MYEITVIPQIERIETIRKKKVSATETHPFYEYQNTRNNLPIVRLDISLPLYRMQNYRTKTMQFSFIKSNEKQQEYFNTGQENIEVQKVQHEILLKLANKGVENSITPIIDVLEKEIQKIPLILTYDGVVVNGNRRLAAMRYLYAEKGKSHFEYIDCAILPEGATEDEIRDVEVRLQMTPQTELPYDWVIEAMATKDLLTQKGDDKIVADLMDIRPSEVRDKVLSIELVDDYLSRWLKQSGSYDLVEDKQQWFSDFSKKSQKRIPEEKILAQTIAFLLAGKSSLLDGRLYNYTNIVDKFLPDVAKKLASNREISLEMTQNIPTSLFCDEEMEPSFSYQPLVDIIETIHYTGGEEEDLLVLEIKTIFEDTKAKAEDNIKGEQAMKLIMEVHTKLRTVNLSEADPSTYSKIIPQLSMIEELVHKLQTELSTKHKV